MSEQAKSVIESEEDAFYTWRYETAPAHLNILADEQWALWRNVVVRGAGFPLSQVLRLASPSSVCAADQLLQAQCAWRQVSNKVLKYLHSQQKSTMEKDTLRSIAKAIKTIKTTQFEREIHIDITLPEQEMLYLAHEKVREKRTLFMNTYAEASTLLSEVIHEIADDERFREAIIWQNRAALHASIASLLRHGTAARGSEQRRREALIANYLQRYCTKNESIGFFGPLGWAKLRAEGEAIDIKVGKSLLEKREVYFEGWAIDALAEEMAKDSALRPYCVPRLLPHLSLDGALLSVPFASPIKLSSKQAAILSLCDGIRTVKEIARCLQQNTGDVVVSEEEVCSLLTQLHSAKRIEWTLEAPTEGEPRSYPERRLRAVLERIEDDRLREKTLNMLEKLVLARDAVMRAAGDTAALDEAFDHLERCFIELTNRDATRSGGHMYAGRTLVYEDCRRDVTIALGPDFVHTLERPLALLLQAARWFTYEVALSYREAFWQAFDELTGESGVDKVNFADFWLWAQPLVFDETSHRPLDDVVSEFQARWADILILQPAQRHIHFSSEELFPMVQDLFAAPGPGWRDACYHSPDILVCAASPEDICKGEYQFVLGELHIAMNTQQHLAFLEQYPDPDELINFAIQDLPEPRITPIFSKKNYPMTRMRPALIAPKDYRLLYSADVAAQPQAKALPISALEVEVRGDDLVVCTKDGSQQFDIIDVFAEFLSRQVYKEFHLFSHHEYTPRIMVDQMVLVRESWSFAPSEISFADEKDPASRFLAARAWTQAHGIPRFTFVKVPGELKPSFIDFASPLYVDAFAKLVRNNKGSDTQNKIVKVTEMLPEPGQSWLIDAEGQHYSSELRFVAVDMIRPS